MDVKLSVIFRGGAPVWTTIPGTGDAVSARVSTDALIGPALKQALQRSAIMVQNDAKVFAPVDTGRLRASITHALDSRPVPLYATVGTNVAYAERVHDGTPRGTHVPPAALKTWARRHNMNPYAVSRAIQQRGIAANPFLEHSLRDNVSRIRNEMAYAARTIEAAWKTP